MKVTGLVAEFSKPIIEANGCSLYDSLKANLDKDLIRLNHINLFDSKTVFCNSLCTYTICLTVMPVANRLHQICF